MDENRIKKFLKDPLAPGFNTPTVGQKNELEIRIGHFIDKLPGGDFCLVQVIEHFDKSSKRKVMQDIVIRLPEKQLQSFMDQIEKFRNESSEIEKDTVDL